VGNPTPIPNLQCSGQSKIVCYFLSSRSFLLERGHWARFTWHCYEYEAGFTREAEEAREAFAGYSLGIIPGSITHAQTLPQADTTAPPPKPRHHRPRLQHERTCRRSALPSSPWKALRLSRLPSPQISISGTPKLTQQTQLQLESANHQDLEPTAIPTPPPESRPRVPPKLSSARQWPPPPALCTLFEVVALCCGFFCYMQDLLKYKSLPQLACILSSSPVLGSDFYSPIYIHSKLQRVGNPILPKIPGA
jgi:hypothetical protein